MEPFLSTARSGPPAAAGLPGARFLTTAGVPLLALAFFVVMGLVFMRQEDSLWLRTFRQAALRMQAGETIHVIERDAYAYPPAMAMFSWPLANFSPEVSQFLWYLVNVLAACIVFTLAWRLAGGPRLTALHGAWHLVFWLVILLGLKNFTKPLETRQFDMVIAACLLGGIQGLSRGRDRLAGLLFGLAAAMKLTPLLFLPYLAWKRRWAALVMMLAAGALVTGLPDVLWPQANGVSYSADFVNRCLRRVSGEAPGVWFNDQIHYNQSLAGLFNRYFRLGLPAEFHDHQITPGQADPRLVLPIRLCTYGAAGLLLAVTAGILLTRRRPGGDLAASAGPYPELEVPIECSIILCLMLLISPMTSREHFVTLLLPTTILARVLIEQRQPWMFVLLAGLLITGPLSAKGIIGSQLGNLYMVWGVPTYFVLLLLVAMWTVAWHRTKPAAAAELPCVALTDFRLQAR